MHLQLISRNKIQFLVVAENHNCKQKLSKTAMWPTALFFLQISVSSTHLPSLTQTQNQQLSGVIPYSTFLSRDDNACRTWQDGDGSLKDAEDDDDDKQRHQGGRLTW